MAGSRATGHCNESEVLFLVLPITQVTILALVGHIIIHTCTTSIYFVRVEHKNFLKYIYY